MSDAKFQRRSLLKGAAWAAGGLALQAGLAEPIRRAAAIEPDRGSTFLDAEHIVFLMQENRSFDHCFGTLRGVRGFNDPRAIDLPGGRPVWLQANSTGEVFVPFRLDLSRTNTTWLDGLPHNWPDQVDARHDGKHDRWLHVKIPVGSKQLAHFPLTLGYHTRADIPFYYELADAFTICDQHFCSSLTGTTPNRLHFWTGTIRAEQQADALPHVYNSDTDHIGRLTWTTFPERLSAHGISWRVYQNELTVPSGMTDEEAAWLGNFGDNPLEYFRQYEARFAPCHVAYLQRFADSLRQAIPQLEAAVAKEATTAAAAQLAKARAALRQVERDLETFHSDRFAQRTALEREIHERAFTTNRAAADYRGLTPPEAGPARGRMDRIPKGDLFHQFRADAQAGKLPAVSWLVAPSHFSDHPSSAWFGAWYVSEALDILTQNPALWKRTIFVLNYDENDGFFDHCPPFVAPAPGQPASGGCSAGVDSTLEFTERDRRSPIGLGYRVPLIVASPWSRGGWVNSQVFDLTSPIRFLEQFFLRKKKIVVRESNLSSWRRTVVGDLTSVFRPGDEAPAPLPKSVDRAAWMRSIRAARQMPLPDPGAPLTEAEIAAIKADRNHPRRPRQEVGLRPACALPYELRADAELHAAREKLILTLAADKRLFGAAAAGSPFLVYAPGRVKAAGQDSPAAWEEVRVWNYAVAAGASLTAEWLLTDFEHERYHLRVYGPNGFYRELIGAASDPNLSIRAALEQDPTGAATDHLTLALTASASKAGSEAAYEVLLTANAYDHAPLRKKIQPGAAAEMALPLAASFGWYDFTIRVAGAASYARRYAGRIETGRPSKSDPQMS
ncbi:MAG TPA: phospholipase C, phosphocholine-specific [Pirellulales bacterium]|nr:phospholipase C, phosphocholine-specific [Pirellulales bacterium]